MDKYTFVGRAALLTGAASGIGTALALDLAARGSDLALVDRDTAGLTRLQKQITRAHPSIHVTIHTADLAEKSDYAGLMDEVATAHQRLGLLINNAGVALGGKVEDISLDDLDWIMTINFRTPVALVQAALPHLLATGDAHIVNVSSLFGLIGPAGQAAYSASKFAIRGFTQSLQAELIPRGVGVTVVHPGGIATNIATNARMSAALDAAAAEKGRRAIGALLTMPPEQAARQITAAIRNRRERLVITRQAVLIDRISRLAPVHSRTIIARRASSSS